MEELTPFHQRKDLQGGVYEEHSGYIPLFLERFRIRISRKRMSCKNFKIFSVVKMTSKPFFKIRLRDSRCLRDSYVSFFFFVFRIISTKPKEINVMNIMMFTILRNTLIMMTMNMFSVVMFTNILLQI